MDALDRLAGPAADLLDRVDNALALAGAPDDHPVWPLLRRLRALPGEAVAGFAAATPEAFGIAGDSLRQAAERYADTSATMPDAPGWRGAGAQSFAGRWGALRDHLGDGLTGRMRATLSYVEAIEDWIRETRDELARTLAVVLGSAEAVRVRTADTDPDSGRFPAMSPEAAGAAAEIAARVLRTLAEAYDRGQAVLEDWARRLDEAAYRPPVGAPPPDRDVTTEVFF